MRVSFGGARPSGGTEQDAVRRAAFAGRLKAAIDRKGWSLSQTARQASQVLGPDAKFGRAHVWRYLHQRAMPRERQLNALSHALEVEPNDLLALEPAPQGRGEATGRAGVVRAQDQGDGTVVLEIVQQVPWEIALKVLRVLKVEDEEPRSEPRAAPPEGP